MKKTLLQLVFITCIINAYAQNPTIQVSGSNIVGVCNDNIILRGINYAPFDWGYDVTDEKFAEIAKTGANCVRIVWYSSAAAGGGASVYGNIANLDTAIARCIRNKMIPIIELHDITCNGDISQIATLSNWYLGAGVKAIISKYAHNLIINIANEAGYVQWASNPTTALASFKSTYEGVATNFRTAGINVPLMIDAPDCGTNMDAFASIAASMETADPAHNLIFSAHAYWYAYANNDSLTMRTKITNALALGVPIVFGEVANLQDDANPCEYTLNYKAFLNICQQLNVSWLAWSWDHDVCSARQISSTGYYVNLTTYGNDIVNNSGYGLSSQATLTSYLANNQVCSTVITASSNSPVCIGNTLKLSSAAGVSYAWVGPNGFNSTVQNPSISSATFAMTGTYSVTVTSSDNSSVTASTDVIIDSLPIFTSQPSTQSVAAGATVAFSVTATGAELAYQWRKGMMNITNSTSVSGATSSSLTISLVSATDAAINYNCLVTTSAGCSVASANASLTVATSAPVITVQPASPTSIPCEGSVVSFKVTATGTALTYQWYNGTSALVNGGNFAGAATAALTINPVNTSNADSYYVIVSNPVGSVISNTVSLAVNAKPVITSQPLSSQLACLGSAANFSVGATGTGLSYQWKKGMTLLTDGITTSGSIISGSSSPNLTISTITAADAAIYSCLVKGTCNAIGVASSNAALIVGVPAKPLAITAQTGGTIICPGDQYTYSIRKVINATSYGWTVNHGSGSITHLSSGATDTTITVTYTSTIATKDTISVTANDACGASLPAVLPISPNTPGKPLLITAQTGGVKVCPGDVYTYSITAVLPAGTDAPHYDWVAPLSGIFIGNHSGTSVSVQYVGVIPVRDTIFVRATNGCSSSLYTFLVITPNTPAKPIAITAQTGGLKVCPGDIYTYSIAAVLPTGIDAPHYDWVAPVSGIFVGSHSGTTVSVQYNATIPLRDTIFVRATNSCSSSLYTFLVITPNTPAKPIAITAQTGGLKVCPDDIYTYSTAAVLPTGIDASHYDWVAPVSGSFVGSHNGTTVSVQYNTTIPLRDTIFVRATNGCSSSLYTFLVITPNTPAKPIAITAQTGGLKVCPGDVYTYSTAAVLPTGIDAPHYDWVAPLSGSFVGSYNGTTVSVQYNTTIPLRDTIFVRATNSCSSSAYTFLVITPNTVAKPVIITPPAGGTTICPGNEFIYTIRKVTGANAGYAWTSPKSGHFTGSSNDTIVTVHYDSAIPVQDTLAVSALNGCGASLATILIIKPNTFAPAAPGTITGRTYGVKDSANLLYSIIPVTGMTYNWGWSGAGPSPASSAQLNSNSGSSITANFGHTFCAATFTVTATNTCGHTSLASTLIVSGKPATAPVINSSAGSNSVCYSQTITYSINPIADVNLGYLWTLPSGWSGTSTTNSITVNITSSSLSGNISVLGKDSCGNGLPAILAVTVTGPCGSRQMSAAMNEGGLAIYPNPTSGLITYSFESSGESSGTIQVMDAVGKVIENKTIAIATGVNNYELDMTDYAKGLYMLILRTEDGARKGRVVVQ